LTTIFLGFPGPPQTRCTPSFLISKKKLKFDGGYYTVKSKDMSTELNPLYFSCQEPAAATKGCGSGTIMSKQS
jgi:hypothetical protein